MSLMSWLKPKNPGQGALSGAAKVRRSFRETTLPLISPRRGRRLLRREQLFSVVRESLIRAGVLSSSYEFKVLALDSNGDRFLVLVDLALPAKDMPDEYLLEVETWIQKSARSRHSMDVPSVYWRRQAAKEQRGIALKASVGAQSQRTETAEVPPSPLTDDEVRNFRKALQTPAMPKHVHRGERVSPNRPESSDENDSESQSEDGSFETPPESHSDFSALSETQYGKL